MFKRNSIFVHILLPVIVVMLLQTLLISIVLTANGTFSTLDKNAADSLKKNADNRGIALENLMVHYLSNLDKLEAEVIGTIDAYLAENAAAINDILDNTEQQNSILNNLSSPLIDALRLSSSTGAYFYFISDFSPNMPALPEHNYAGLYYRDLDPVTTPANYSDIIYYRGPVNIARKDKIQLDSFWKSSFEFTQDNIESWRDCNELLSAAQSKPDTPRGDMYYWNVPHFVSSDATDVNECITYSRLIYYYNRPIGVIGTEFQTEQLKKYFPAADFDSSGKAGYLLLTYDDAAQEQEKDYNLHAVTGSYIKRILGSQTTVRLDKAETDNTYRLSSKSDEPMHVAVQKLNLYNSGSPFYNIKWALASAGMDSLIFAASSNLRKGLLYSSAIALIIGVLLLSFIVRMSTRPLINIAGQLEISDPSKLVELKKTNTYEIDLLCETINSISSKRQIAEAELRDERERYLIALENVADTFMEYDAKQDSFMLYYFRTEGEKPVLCSHITREFSRRLEAGELCHRDDIRKMTSFFNGQNTLPLELRIKCTLFSHISDTESDGEYYRFSFKASKIFDETGGIDKIIGIARDITAEKLREQALIESSRRDLTTKLYNLDYGLLLVREKLAEAAAKNKPFALVAIHVQNFDMFEAYYGRVFSAAVLMRLCMQTEMLLEDDDIALRANNDIFIAYLARVDAKGVRGSIERLLQKIEKLYVGENDELRLSICVGAALNGDGDSDDPDELIGRALSAMRLASKKEQIVFASNVPADAAPYIDFLNQKPISVSLDISKETINNVTFDLFERTSDIPSVVNMTIQLVGRLFSLCQVLICNYDPDFGTNQVTYQWNRSFIKPYRDNISKISHDDFCACERLLCENGTIVYDPILAESFCQGVRELLCVRKDEQVSVLGCAMYENGIYSGMLIFKALADGNSWSDEDTRILHGITKMICAHISIYKSNSASKAKSDFLSRMSHEIRTPMNAIIGMTHIAKSNINNPNRLGDCLNTIDFSSKHLLALINDVLDMSRIESGKLNIEAIQFSLNSLLETLERLMSPQFSGKNIRFIIKKDILRDLVIGDEYRLRQVLVNLLGNACKFTDAGGTVTLSLSEHKNSGVYRFSVSDTGIGISNEARSRVFKAFEQAANSPQNKQGTGLGLAISSSIISAMGGKIELISNPGQGSEFYFTLRLEKADEPASRTTGVSGDSLVSELRVAGRRVLLVEDNDINMEIASFILTDAEMIVEPARNGKEAVDMFTASEPGYYDVILMDIQMPVMDGLTATRKIRQIRSRPDARTIPIIAMTANAFDKDMKKSIESGMNGHLTKPIEQDKLFAMLSELFLSKEASEQ